MINFKANLLNTAKIKIHTDKENYKDYNVSFVKLDTNSKSDLRAIREVDKNWGNSTTFANDINFFFKDCFVKKDDDKLSFYALTKQCDKFEHLNSDDIVGLAQVTEDSPTRIYLDYLQADPENNYFAIEPLYKKIGTAIMDSLRKIFSNKEMLLYSLDDARPFYEKLGFKWTAEGLLTKRL